MGNGPESSGDGWKYRGRGFFQLVGRDTYGQFSQDTGIDLITNPEAANDPNVALLIAAIFWSKQGLNELADNDDTTGITRKVTGGTFGLESRTTYSALALKLLGEKN